MPQIAQIDATFASQLFWLIVTFGLIFVVIGLGMVPKISGTVEARDMRIQQDLEAAERARGEADATEEAYRLRTEQNRAEALKVTTAAKAASALEAERKLKAADVELGERVANAEARVRSARDTALADIDTVAAEAAQEMVAKLSGAEVSREQAVQAVKAAMANG